MIIEVDKKYFIGIVAVMLILGGIFFVVSYGTSAPATFGHSASEIEGVCLSNGTGCPAGCVLYENVHSVTCPSGKYVMKFYPLGGSDCASFTTSDCYYPSVVVAMPTSSCPSLNYISNNITFGYIGGSATIKRCIATSSSHIGNVLCC